MIDELLDLDSLYVEVRLFDPQTTLSVSALGYSRSQARYPYHRDQDCHDSTARSLSVNRCDQRSHQNAAFDLWKG